MGKPGAWDLPAVQKLCADHVNDALSAYLVTDDDVLVFDPWWDMVSLSDVTGQVLPISAISGGIDVSVEEDNKGNILSETLVLMPDNSDTITMCRFTTSPFRFMGCRSQALTVASSSQRFQSGIVNDLFCVKSAATCSVATSTGVYVVNTQGIIDPDRPSAFSMSLTRLVDGPSDACPDCTLPFIATTLFLESPFNATTCKLSIAFTNAEHIVRSLDPLKSMACPSGAAQPRWRLDWTKAFRQGDDDEVISKLRFSPDGSLWWTIKDAVYRQASSLSPDMPLTIHRMGSLEGLPYNDTTTLAAGRYSYSGPTNHVTATSAFVGTTRGMVVVEDSLAVADDHAMRVRETHEGGSIKQPAQSSTHAAGTRARAGATAVVDDARHRYFRYMYGPRWAPTMSCDKDKSDAAHSSQRSPPAPAGTGAATGSNRVIATAASHFGRSVWVVYPTGLARIDLVENWTLADKAVVMEQQTYPHHDRMGYTTDVNLGTFGDLQSYGQYASDNDGLWTAINLAGQTFKRALDLSKAANEEAEGNIRHHLAALQTLYKATGKKGLMARTVLPVGEPTPRGDWHNSTTMPELQWKGDTSSDEVVGHMFAFPLISFLLRDSMPDVVRAARGLLSDTVRGILDDGYYLIDVTGKPTLWGVWAPKDLNLNTFYFDGRGLNSMQILAYMNALNAFDQRDANVTSYVKAHVDNLVNNHGYDRNLLNLKIEIPDDNNFSDDELTFLPYFTWKLADLQTALSSASASSRTGPRTVSPVMSAQTQRYFNNSMERTWRFVEDEKASLWNAIYGFSRAVSLVTKELSHSSSSSSSSSTSPTAAPVAFPPSNPRAYMPASALKAIAEQLRRFPIELVDWPYDNSHRLDVSIGPYGSRDSHRPHTTRVIPLDEARASKWNMDFYVAEGGDGASASEPSMFSLPYYLARYMKYISPPTE